MLTEGGLVLLQHGGSFRSFISQAGNDARKMVELIVEKIPSYRDEAAFEVRSHTHRSRHSVTIKELNFDDFPH